MIRYDALAKHVLFSTLGIQSGDNVIVETWDHGLPIASAFIYALREQGACPMLMFEHEGTFWKSAASVPEDKLGKVGEHEWAAMEKARGYVFIPGPADFRKIWKNRPKFGAAVSYNDEWYERAKRYRLKGARIGLGYATQSRANAYRLSLSAWQRMLIAASTVDFAVLRDRVARLAPMLQNGQVKITAPNGTNLTVRLAGRTPHSEDCIVDDDDLDQGRNVANIPGGNILVCPDESYAEGAVFFDRPASYMGRWVGGVRLNFKNGVLSNYQVRLNAATLKAGYEKASGDKNRIATIGLGLNPKARIGFLQDNIVAGSVTVAIGGNENLGGANKSNFYLPGVITKATLSVDDKLIVKNGKLVL